jgi:hypothetical protein
MGVSPLTFIHILALAASAFSRSRVPVPFLVLGSLKSGKQGGRLNCMDWRKNHGFEMYIKVRCIATFSILSRLLTLPQKLING